MKNSEKFKELHCPYIYVETLSSIKNFLTVSLLLEVGDVEHFHYKSGCSIGETHR